MIDSLMVAIANNTAMGKDNNLLWHLPADMKFFRETTTGHCIITGRKNYESIPARFRPLKNRTNIVVTRNLDYLEPNIQVCNSIEFAIDFAKRTGEKEVFVIGGGQIYAECLEKNLIDKMYITHVDSTFEADTFFPDFDKKNWKSSIISELEKSEKNPFEAKIFQYDRL
jgi:dihydrofolate reductase